MKILKLLLTAAILTGGASIFCNESDSQHTPKESKMEESVTNSYTYWGIGAGFPTLLSANVGHRAQIHHHGFDYGIGITPLIEGIEVHGFTNYLCYLNPNYHAQSYIGLGLRTGAFLPRFTRLHNYSIYIAPQIILGKEYKTQNNNQQFIQVAVSPGGMYTTDILNILDSSKLKFGLLPSINVSWGFAF